MSELAHELLHFASVLRRDADKQSNPEEARRIASAWQALILECTPIDSIDDCTEVYGDDIGDTAIFDLMDADVDNGCPHPGGHLWVAISHDVAICAHCRASGMPVYATREAE